MNAESRVEVCDKKIVACKNELINITDRHTALNLTLESEIQEMERNLSTTSDMFVTCKALAADRTEELIALNKTLHHNISEVGKWKLKSTNCSNTLKLCKDALETSSIPAKDFYDKASIPGIVVL